MYFVSIILLLCVLILGSDSSALNVRYNKLVVFGDSYSDTGNVYELTNDAYPISPPYYQGRFSNGLIWVDQLNVPQKVSYAYGSATTDNNLAVGRTNFNTVVVPGIRQQVDTYLSKTRQNQVQHKHAVHVVWGGGNDFVATLSGGSLPSVNSTQSIASLTNSIRILLDAGVRTIVVCNQPPGQLLPYASTLGPLAGLVGGLINSLNTGIAAQLAALKPNYPDADIYLFDVNTLLIDVIANTELTFVNTVDACWIVISPTFITTPCPNPDQYIFVDPFHVSAPVHQLIADAFQTLFSGPRHFATLSPYFHLI